MTMTETVWVWYLSTPQGEDNAVFTTEEDALASVYGYVKYWWDEEVDGEEIPPGRDDAILAYFDLVDDEYSTVSEQVIHHQPFDYGQGSD